MQMSWNFTSGHHFSQWTYAENLVKICQILTELGEVTIPDPYLALRIDYCGLQSLHSLNETLNKLAIHIDVYTVVLGIGSIFTSNQRFGRTNWWSIALSVHGTPNFCTCMDDGTREWCQPLLWPLGTGLDISGGLMARGHPKLGPGHLIFAN